VQNFEARKHLLEYDDVNNKQRQAVYGMRRQLLEGVDQKEHILDMMRGIVEQTVDMRCPTAKHPDTWDLGSLRNDILSLFGARIDLADLGNMTKDEISDAIADKLKAKYEEKEALVGVDTMRHAERIVMLNVIDNQWKDHLLSMDELKQGIGNRAYGQKDPLVEYKKESFDLFSAMMDRVEDETVRYLYFLQVTQNAPVMPFNEDGEETEGGEDTQGGDGKPSSRPSGPKPTPAEAAAEAQRQAAKSSMEDFTRNIQRKKDRELQALQLGGDDSGGSKTVVAGQKVGRNDPCPCGSGKKYKKCHGA
jgi:preprotein translocase subunit SecA